MSKEIYVKGCFKRTIPDDLLDHFNQGRNLTCDIRMKDYFAFITFRRADDAA